MATGKLRAFNLAPQGGIRPLLAVIFVLLLLLTGEMLAQPVNENRKAAQEPTLPEPLFVLPGGFYAESQMLALQLPPTVKAKQAHIVFTIDGRSPTASSTIYDQPIYLDAHYPAVVVVKARLVGENGRLGPITSQSYFLNITEPLPLVSLAVDPDDFWDPQTGIYTHPAERGAEWERPVQVTYVDSDRQTGFQIAAGVRIHGQYSRDYAKKSLRLYFRPEYGAGRLNYPLFATGGQSFDRLVLHAGGQDASQLPTNWTLLRNQLMANLAAQTNSLSTRSQPVLLFVNGEPWGLYYWRDRIDPVFLAEEWGVATAVIVDTPARRSENPADINAAFDQWDRLTAFVAEQDMGDPASYAYVASQVDIANFIDYSLLQIYSANYDWPFTNIKQFRPQTQGGRWQWIMWDSDLSLGLKPWSDISQNTLAQALDPAYTAGTSLETNGRDTILLRGLLQNEAFRARFLSRADELLHTVLAPDAVIGQIDTLAAAIEPAIGFENGRWDESSPAAEWAANVEQLRDFARRRPDILRQQFVESLQLPGLATLQFTAPQNGQLVVGDGLAVPIGPAIYFQGGELVVTAVPDPGYRFAGWETPAGTNENPLIFNISSDQTITARFEPVDPAAPHPGDVIFEQVCRQDDADWLELRVVRPGGVDLRGWRLTDNDRKTAHDEGSLVFTNHPALANVPEGTAVFIRLGEHGEDDLAAGDGELTLFAENGVVDGRADPWFRLGSGDNLALLAPGAADEWTDDQAIALVIMGGEPISTSALDILADGVWPQTAACQH